ncbi:hypothetical protein [Arenimonas sp. MALMAid1274]|uniref:hypothetical protein n=1 Tax=Arenimonas sp. MALMAid1274 TaxID=3411630 RepID=UPI003B9E9E59
MYRMLLVLSLALFATGSQAAEAVPVESESEACPKSEPAAGKPAANGEGTSSTARPGAPAPVRPRSTSARGTPRWQSLLPGMFR